MTTQVERMWTAETAAVPQVRAWTRSVLSDGGVPAETIDAAELVVAELTANAITHTASAVFAVHLDACAVAVVVAVSDQGSRSVPIPAPREADETGGRGLALVEALSDEWHVSGDAGGRLVSAVLPIAPRPVAWPRPVRWAAPMVAVGCALALALVPPFLAPASFGWLGMVLGLVLMAAAVVSVLALVRPLDGGDAR